MPPLTRNGDEPGPFDDARPAVLRGESAREVLAKLCEDDVLEIGPRCSARIDEKALLLDPMRVWHRALGRIAYDSMRWRGEPELAEFLQRAIDRSMKELVEEEAETAFHGVADEECTLAHYGFLSELLGIEPSITRRACAAFNALPRAERVLWWRVCVQGEQLVDAASRSKLPVEEVSRRLTATFELLSRAAGRKIELPRKVDP